MLFERRSTKAKRVIKALSVGPDMTAAEISKSTGIGSGTLYPILMEMERLGTLTSRWETENRRPSGPPRRRYYGLPGADARS